LGIAFGSISTGLPKDIVKQIMTAERIPINKMEERKSKIAEKQGLVNDLATKVENINSQLTQNGNARSLRELKSKYNEELIDLNVDKNVAEPGSYQFEVVQLAQKSSAMTSGFEDPEDSYVGTGFIQYQLPNGDSQDVFIGPGTSSLKDIAKLINKDPENGLRATVINDGTGSDAPWRLLLSLAETGDENRAEFPYFYMVDGDNDFYLEFEREAHDAIVKLDGFEIEIAKNKTSDLIPGTTIDLKKAQPGEEFSIIIDEDTQAISEKVQGFVDQVNEVLQFIIDQNSLDEKTDTSRTLGGDIILQTIESRLRAAVFQDVNTYKGKRRVGDLGVTFQRNGLLALDQEKLDSIISSDYKLVSEVMNGRFDEDGRKVKGFVDHLKDTVGGMLRRPGGMLASRKKTVQSSIDQIDRRISQKERMLEQKEKNLKDRFARLEGIVSKIKSQGAGLAGLGAGASNPITQLG
jgi:flagellar hook-associated protein 2